MGIAAITPPKNKNLPDGNGLAFINEYAFDLNLSEEAKTYKFDDPEIIKIIDDLSELETNNELSEEETKKEIEEIEKDINEILEFLKLGKSANFNEQREKEELLKEKESYLNYHKARLRNTQIITKEFYFKSLDTIAAAAGKKFDDDERKIINLLKEVENIAKENLLYSRAINQILFKINFDNGKLLKEFADEYYNNKVIGKETVLERAILNDNISLKELPFVYHLYKNTSSNVAFKKKKEEYKNAAEIKSE